MTYHIQNLKYVFFTKKKKNNKVEVPLKIYIFHKLHHSYIDFIYSCKDLKLLGTYLQWIYKKVLRYVLILSLAV